MTINSTTATSDSSGLFDRLRGLIEACGPQANRHDKAIAVITACIEEGVDTRPRIIGMLKHLGFDHRHAAMTLNGAAGHLPESHRWQRDALGHYSLLS